MTGAIIDMTAIPVTMITRIIRDIIKVMNPILMGAVIMVMKETIAVMAGIMTMESAPESGIRVILQDIPIMLRDNVSKIIMSVVVDREVSIAHWIVPPTTAVKSPSFSV